MKISLPTVAEIRAGFSAVRRFIVRLAPDVFTEAMGMAGAGFVAYGAWLIYKPAGFITLGVLLIAFAWALQGDKQPTATLADLDQ